ncbi:MAG TPA: hypothetical protein VKI64_01485 [Acidimicrobiales bacterium]|nr:hypothetical protein [Acidimicrobiales bacterium]
MVWPPHSLAGEPIPELTLGVGDRVAAAVDMPDVPEGTTGRVTLVDGFAWRRYTVRFENGVFVGFLDGRHIKLVRRRRGLRRR